MKIKFEKPTLQDIDAMQKLIKPQVEKGIILHRSDDELAANIRSYFIAKYAQDIIGFCSLQIYSKDLAELRSLVVKDKFRRQGVGRGLVVNLEKEGKNLGLKQIFALTYERGFFESLGYMEIDKDKLPEQKIWADCIKCKLFPICKEIAFIKQI